MICIKLKFEHSSAFCEKHEETCQEIFRGLIICIVVYLYFLKSKLNSLTKDYRYVCL